MEKGKVKWFNRVKNFGFIESNSGKDLFVHGSEVKEKEKLVEGTEVEFEIVPGSKGEKAIKVGIIEK